MENDELLRVLNANYDLNLSHIELFRAGGNTTYTVGTGDHRYFLKRVGPAFFDTVRTSVDVNLYLNGKGFPAPRVILTKDGQSPFAADRDSLLVLYEYLETTEIDMERDAEAVGALTGRMHRLMEAYPGQLVKRDQRFYIGRYIEILRKKQYPKIDGFIRYGEDLWDRVGRLPYGYSHGDLYCGNIARGTDGRLYVLDFDTSCIGFPLYDLALICNRTDYFRYDEKGLPETLAIYRRLLPEYEKAHRLAECSACSLCDMLALYHFALQATIIEIYGLDCVDHAFFDKQLLWLNNWKLQCSTMPDA